MDEKKQTFRLSVPIAVDSENQAYTFYSTHCGLTKMATVLQTKLSTLNYFFLSIQNGSRSALVWAMASLWASKKPVLEMKMTHFTDTHAVPGLNTLRPRQNGRNFAEDIFICIFLNENVWIPIRISLKFVPKCLINNNPALVQIMAWCRPGDKPLSKPMMVSLPTHICAIRPQWVNEFD